MPDEGLADSGVATSATGETTTDSGVVGASELSAPSIIGEDGVFTENWKDVLDEGIRHESSLGTFHNIQGLAKAFVDTKKMVGKDKVAIPTENSTDDEWEAFHEAAGRPGTAAEYALARPNDFPEELFDVSLVEKAQEVFHKIGLNKTQADALLAFNLETALAAAKDSEAAVEAAKKEAEDALHAEWGNAYEQKLHNGNRAIKEGAGDDADLLERVTQKFGNDTDFVRLMSNIGDKFGEHSSAGIKPAQIATPAEIDAKIQDAMLDKAFTDRTHPKHKQQVELVNRLYKEKHEGK